jgi:vacuolar-type H+-ATPase subunit F/Vma7
MGIVVDFVEDVVVAFKIVGMEKVEISDDEVIAVAVNADV